MGFWKKKNADLEEMYKIVAAQQGTSARGIAEEIGVSPSTVTLCVGQHGRGRLPVVRG